MADQRADAPAGGLGARTIAALVMAPPVLLAVHYGSPLFESMVVLGGLVLIWEWRGICQGDAGWMMVGLVVVMASCAALVWLRLDPAYGRETMFWMMAAIWATDIGAYAAGRTIGGPKLAPAISPKKTWAGLAGGVACAACVGAGAATLLGKASAIPLATISAGLAVIGQVGDLLESSLKRRFGVKDASRLIPGHGGLLDRVDGLLAAALIIAMGHWLSGRGVLEWL